ncbi:FYVE zinc finger, partial [Ancylostoma duodenale]
MAHAAGAVDGSDVVRRKEGVITFFDRLEEEAAEESLSGSSGVLSSLFGRLWRPQSTASSEPSGSATFYVEETTSKGSEDDEALDILPSNPLAGDTASSNATPSRTLANGQYGTGRASPTATSLSQYWMPDSTGKECYQCEERFSTFRRRHHCRLCGQIFCAKCCNIHVPGSALGYIGDLRLCHYCAKMMAQYLPPEQDRLQSEELSNGAITNEEPTVQTNDTLGVGGRTVSTVSSVLRDARAVAYDTNLSSAVARNEREGSMMWSHPSDVGSSTLEKKDTSFIPPTATTKPPSLLCATELYLQHEKRSGSQSDSITTELHEEEESGPDWFRNMDPDTNFPMKDIDQ